MAVVFELSRYIQESPLENFNIWFCQFSAEELGTMGSRIFVNNHEANFVKGRVFQINIDMLSCACAPRNQIEYLKSFGVLPRKKIAPLLSKYLEKAASNFFSVSTFIKFEMIARAFQVRIRYLLFKRSIKEDM